MALVIHSNSWETRTLRKDGVSSLSKGIIPYIPLDKRLPPMGRPNSDHESPFWPRKRHQVYIHLACSRHCEMIFIWSAGPGIVTQASPRDEAKDSHLRVPRGEWAPPPFRWNLLWYVLRKPRKMTVAYVSVWQSTSLCTYFSVHWFGTTA